MQQNGRQLYFLLAICLLASCAQVEEEIPAPLPLRLGIWRAQLETPGGPLPFGLELTDSQKGVVGAFIVNGKERIEIPQVGIIGDTLTLNIDHYDSKLEARITANGKRLRGRWRKRRGPDRWSELPFEARFGDGRRFRKEPRPAGTSFDFSGRWRVKFATDEEDAVALFRQSGRDQWEGTFLTTTGDYRFLAGSRDANRLRLSCFDGAHAFLFDVKSDLGGDLSGDFWNWDSWHDTWSARRDDEAELPDGFAQTKWNGKKTLETLEFPDLNGKIQKISELMRGGNAMILQIFGSWCPNCHDASEFLVELERTYGTQGLKICGVAFELSGEFERDTQQVRRYVQRHQIGWPIVLGGIADKKTATQSFGGVDFIRSYPTFIFFDKDGKVAGVYSGFSGPATGEAHVRLKKRMRKLVEDLIARS